MKDARFNPLFFEHTNFVQLGGALKKRAYGAGTGAANSSVNFVNLFPPMIVINTRDTSNGSRSPPMNYCEKPDYISEFVALLECDVRCYEFLVKVRWPEGFQCPRCACRKGYRLCEDFRYQCADCGYQVSATAGTIFHGTHVAIRKWFLAILLISTDKGGISAMRLHETLAVSYRTAWAMLSKLRSVKGALLASLIKDAGGIGIGKILHSKNRRPVEALVVSQQDENGREKICLLAPENIDRPSLRHSSDNSATSRDRRFRVAGAVALAKEFFLGTYHRAASPENQQ